MCCLWNEEHSLESNDFFSWTKAAAKVAKLMSLLLTSKDYSSSVIYMLSLFHAEFTSRLVPGIKTNHYVPYFPFLFLTLFNHLYFALACISFSSLVLKLRRDMPLSLFSSFVYTSFIKAKLSFKIYPSMAVYFLLA